jgi:UDP-glucose 4-epimerase
MPAQSRGLPVRSPSYENSRVLVAGGLGFIGSNLAIRLVDLGADVAVVDALIPDHGGNRFNIVPVEDRVRVEIADLRDQAAMEALVAGQDVVFNLAGQVSHIDSMTNPAGDLELNYRSQLSLLEACRRRNGDGRIVFTASRQQYGRPRYLPVDEQHPLEPLDVNGVNKAAAEASLLVYHRAHGLPVCSLRLTNTYGPRMQMRHPRQGFAPWFVRLALEGREIELYGGGTALRDFNYVDDVVDALLLAGRAEPAVGHIYNLGHPEPTSVRGFAETLLEVTGDGSLRDVPFPEERALIDVGSVYADFRKIRDELGWEPKTSLRDGLGRTVEYFQAHKSAYW